MPGHESNQCTGMFLEGSRTSLSILKLVSPYWNNAFLTHLMIATPKVIIIKDKKGSKTIQLVAYRPWVINWRARCKNGLSDDFGPTFTKPPNYLLSCNVTVAKWIVSCSQHIVLVIWIEFPPKLYQVTLLLARKVKLPKCHQIPIISAGGKKQFCCCPWWMWLKKKKNRKLDLQQWIT